MSNNIGYISYPITVEYQDVLQEAYDYIQSKFPNWLPADGNLDTATLQSWATEAAQLRELASAVPDAVFRTFGSKLLSFPPIDATPASVRSTWTMIDNAGYTIPAGALVAILAAGDQPIPFQVAANVVVLPGETVSSLGGVVLVALEDGAAGTGLGTIGGTVQLIDSLAFVSSIVQTAVSTGGVDAETNDEYFGRLREHLQLLAPRLIVPSDYAIAAKANGAYRALGIGEFNPQNNLLTVDEASFETGVSHWNSRANCTLAQSNAQAADGANSMRLTAASGATMSAGMIAAYSKAVTPGEVISAIASFRAAVTARSVEVGIAFYDVSDVNFQTSGGVATNDATGAWTQASIQIAVPAGAVKASPVVTVFSPANAEQHYVDEVQLRRGALGTDWVPGGTSDTGAPRQVTIAAVDSDGNNLDSGIKAAILGYAQAQREIGFKVNIIDPNVISIDVNYAVVALPGYDHTILKSSIDAALTAFLNPASWGIDPSVRDQSAARTWIATSTLRYQDVAALIRRIEGVSYYNTLQIAYHSNTLVATDLPLGGVAPLVTIGTITGTVS